MADLRAIAGVADDAALMAVRAAKSNTAHHKKAPAQQAPQKADAVATMETWLERGFNLTLIPAFAAMLGLDRGLSYLGNKTGVSALTHTGNAVGFVNNATFAQAGKLSGVSGIVQPIAELAIKPVAWGADLLHATGFTGWRANVNAARVDKHLANLAPHVDALHAMHSRLSGDAHAAVGNVLGFFQGAQAHPMHWDAAHEGAEFAKVMGTAKQQVGKLTGQEGKTALAALGKIEKYATKANTSHFLAEGYKNLPKNVREHSVKAMASTPMMHGFNNVAFLAFGGFSAYRMGRDLDQKLDALKEVYCSFSGRPKDQVSKLEAFTATVPNEGRVALHAIRAGLVKEFGPAALAEAANTVNNVRMTVSQKLGSIGLQILFSMAGTLWRGAMGEQILPAYMGIKEAEKQHAPISKEEFAQFVGTMTQLGEKSQFAQALGEMYAKEYAAHKVTIDGVLCEIGNGTMHKRVEAIQHAYEAAHPEQKKTPAPHAATTPAPQPSKREEAWRRHLNTKPAAHGERHAAPPAASSPHL